MLSITKAEDQRMRIPLNDAGRNGIRELLDSPLSRNYGYHLI